MVIELYLLGNLLNIESEKKSSRITPRSFIYLSQWRPSLLRVKPSCFLGNMLHLLLLKMFSFTPPRLWNCKIILLSKSFFYICSSWIVKGKTSIKLANLSGPSRIFYFYFIFHPIFLKFAHKMWNWIKSKFQI